MRWTKSSGWAAVGGLLAAALHAPPALACGACVSAAQASTTPTVVTGHRMAFAVSATRTVLWDQFEYEGSPAEFSWILPVRPGAYLELAGGAFLRTLEAGTATQVQSPWVSCGGGSMGGSDDFSCNCLPRGTDMETSAGGYSEQKLPPPVQVVSQQTVGPYEVVTIRSTAGEALTAWLDTHGYATSAEATPTLQRYADEGWDFLALRLRPGAGVRQMEPVRVITPGGPWLLPLEMVAIGAGSHVPMVLFLIGEGRLAMTDLPEVSIDAGRLSYAFATDTSNYLELRAEALARNRGKTFLTTQALPLAWMYEGDGPGGQATLVSSAGAPVANLFDLYFLEEGLPPCIDGEELYLDDEVGEFCADCPPVPSGVFHTRFTCNSAGDDFATALVGLRPGRTWLTRVELDIPTSELSGDCTIGVAASTQMMSRWRTAATYTGQPCPGVAQSGLGASPSLLGLALAAVAGLWRRRGRRP